MKEKDEQALHVKLLIIIYLFSHSPLQTYLERIEDGKQPCKHRRVGIDCENTKCPCQPKEREKNEGSG